MGKTSQRRAPRSAASASPPSTSSRAPSKASAASLARFAWVRSFLAFARTFVLAHGFERVSPAGNPEERLEGVLAAVLGACMSLVNHGAPPAELVRLEGLARSLAGAAGAEPPRRSGQRIALLELAALKCPPEILESVASEPPPPFTVSPTFFHVRAWSEHTRRGIPLDDLMLDPSAPRIPESNEWPSQPQPRCFAASAPPDPFPSRDALLRDAWSTHDAPTAAIEALRAEQHDADPGPFYWAVRLATALSEGGAR